MLPRISGTRAIITYFQKTSFYDPIFGSAAQLTSINPHKMLGFLFGIMGNPTPKSDQNVLFFLLGFSDENMIEIS